MRHVLSLCVLAACSVTLMAQTPPVMITIELDNDVIYRGNVSDVSKLAKDPNPTSSVNQSFVHSAVIGDIVAVNGKPFRGLRTYHTLALPFRLNPAPGQPIADFDGGGVFHCIWHILRPDGTYLGTINDRGGSPGPDHVVVGGSGAFFGVTGVHRNMEAITPIRDASMSEDPSRRRIHGGGRSRTVFYLYPKSRPEIETTPGGPAVFHGDDFSLVTSAKPARAGETLILRAKGLGPTSPDLLPPGTKPFRQDPLEEVNSPVEASIGGKAAEVSNKIGWPGTYDLYRVDVRVPSGVVPGMATLQLTAAWITGPEVRIPVQ